MQNFFDWFQANNLDKSHPWLVLGKGPSFAKRDQFDLKQFYTLSLNHAVREQPVTVAHMIDYDVIDACKETVERNAQVLVLPWVPHVNSRPGSQNLGELAKNHPVLRRMDEQGRLLWYNHSLAPEKQGDSPVIQVKFFSTEAVLNLLAQAGVRKIRSLGIDGGASYSPQFHDLENKTLLANGWKSFDIQFDEIAKIIMHTGIDYAPLDVQSPIRVYVATTEVQMLAVKVLEHSIRKHASMSAEVFPLHLAKVEIPTPKDSGNQPRTPFSFQRFLIPALTGYKGKAIYLDSDMQVFKDIRSLWTLPLNGGDLLAAREPGSTGRRPQFSVMLLNCELLRWDIQDIVNNLDAGRLTYEQLMYEMSAAKNIRADIDPHWNSLERYVEGETALVHYTDMQTQPWVSRENPLGYLWVKELFEALDRGFITLDFLKDHVRKGYVRPSLLHQVENRIEDSLLLPRQTCALDKDFIAPFHTIPKHSASPWIRPSAYLKAAVRYHYQKSILSKIERRVRRMF